MTEHIRGRTVPEARTILAFTPRAAAREIDKVLRSAVANAEANHGLIGDELVVSSAFVDEGVTLKRWRPQSRGRAHRIRKRTCHITICAETAGRSRTRRGGASRAPAEAGSGAGARGAGRGRGGRETAEPARTTGRGRRRRPRRAEEAPQTPPRTTPAKRRRSRDAEEMSAEMPRRSEAHPRRRKRMRSRRPRAEESRSGSEDSSRRPARRRHPRLEVELVHGQEGVPGLPHRGRTIRKHIYSKLAHAGLSDILIRKDKQRITSTSTPRARAS